MAVDQSVSRTKDAWTMQEKATGECNSKRHILKMIFHAQYNTEIFFLTHDTKHDHWNNSMVEHVNAESMRCYIQQMVSVTNRGRDAVTKSITTWLQKDIYYNEGIHWL